MRTAPGKEDQESPLLLRISLSESPASETAARIRDQVNATQISSSRHISTTTVKKRLCAADLHGKIAARKPLIRAGSKQKRLFWAKEHKEWTLDQWKSVLWSDESKFEIFGSNHRVFVQRRKDGFYMPGSHREAWRRSANIFRSALQIIEGTCTDNRHYSITEIQFKTDTRRSEGPARKLTNYEEKGRHERWMLVLDLVATQQELELELAVYREELVLVQEESQGQGFIQEQGANLPNQACIQGQGQEENRQNQVMVLELVVLELVLELVVWELVLVLAVLVRVLVLDLVLVLVV
ncbi:unnamed protein product [Ranitomeya imitator]|uniref:Transposase Tc1-like domain-containing protein n=1 Tax=Ranitomeya imitator TaxID=111125 RepID=A0ABN9M3G6_9NEOB|nr:unnamed protein product [Ranitomeya imitator]